MAEDDTLDGEEQLAVGTKDWADVILAMRQSAVDRFNSRRNLEWKLSVTLWGAVALSANVLRFERGGRQPQGPAPSWGYGDHRDARMVGARVLHRRSTRQR
jgi:hypothetical protein